MVNECDIFYLFHKKCSEIAIIVVKNKFSDLDGPPRPPGLSPLILREAVVTPLSIN